MRDFVLEFWTIDHLVGGSQSYGLQNWNAVYKYESNFYLIFGDSEQLEINPTVSQSLPWTMGTPAVIGETFQTGHFDGISTELCHWTDLAVGSTILLCPLKKQHPIIHLLSLGSKTAMKDISLLYSSSPTCCQVHHIDFRCKTMLPRFGYSNMFGATVVSNTACSIGTFYMAISVASPILKRRKRWNSA